MEKKKKYISYRGVESSLLRDHQKANLRSRRPRESCGLWCHKWLSVSKFVLFFTASLLQALGPWMLSTLEVTAVLLIYFLGTSQNLTTGLPTMKHQFSYVHSLVDVVCLSCTRSAILSLAYALGAHYMHRPYLYASYLLAASCFPYILVKTILYHYSINAVAAASIFALTGAFCWFHVFAARRLVDWARRRYQMGLVGFGIPWQEGEEALAVLRHPSDVEEMSKLSDAGTSESAVEDLTPESLADKDSRFVEIDGLKVHYKEACPCIPAGSEGGSVVPDNVGIILVHSFGGGVFSWRHIMEPLAGQCQCRVIAFDRPGFGLTSRPVVPSGDRMDNPYSVASQAYLILKLSAALGLGKVMLVGHADGCLLTMRAVTNATSTQQYMSFSTNCVRPTRVPMMQQAGLPPIVDAASESNCVYPPIPSYQQQMHMQPAHRLSPQGSSDHEINVTVGRGLMLTPLDASDPGLTSPLLHHQHHIPYDHARSVDGRGGMGAEGPSEWDADSSSDQTDKASSEQQDKRKGGGAWGESTAPTAAVLSRESSQDATSGRSSAQESACPGDWSPATQQCTDYMLESTSDMEAEVLRQRFRGLQQRLCCFGVNTPDQYAQMAATAGTCSEGGDKGLSTSARLSSNSATTGTRAIMRSANTSACERQSGMASSSSSPPSQQATHALPQVIGIALLHPSLSGQIGPTLSRLLARTKLGRSILRPMMRSEMGAVTSRKAWHNQAKRTQEVLDLYRNPLRIEGSDAALVEITRLKREDAQGDLPSYFHDARSLAALIVTGEHDKIVPPPKAEALCWDLPKSRMFVLPNCGHLSHEESPEVLLSALEPFCSSALNGAGRAKARVS